jgi:glycosyltransferase involved in cell wall biosynthesis
MDITFVIPVYNERDTLERLAEGIVEHVGAREFEILFIDDGSTDGSYEVICDLCERMEPVHAIRLRGNFGKSAALAAGFKHAKGDFVFTMDSDLQDEPSEIPGFLEKIEEDGLDVVCGWKAKRQDPWHKTVPSRFYNTFVAWLFDIQIHDVNCGFKLLRSEVVKKIEVYGEMHRLIPVLARSLNYRVGEIPVEHRPRQYGVSKYGFERFSRGALDVLTMWFLARYQRQPGHFFGKLGLFQAILGVLAIVFGIPGWAFWGWDTMGAALVAVGLVFFATGGLTVCLGLIAELVLRHFVRIDPTLYIEEREL